MRPELQSVAKHRNESEHSPAVRSGNLVVGVAAGAAPEPGDMWATRGRHGCPMPGLLDDGMF